MAEKKESQAQSPARGGAMGGNRNPGGVRPKNMGGTAKRLLGYLGHRAGWISLALVLTFASTAATLAISRLLQPVINDYILPGDIPGLMRMLAIMAVVVLLGALSSFGQSQIMIRVAQHTVREIRNELFQKLQMLPVRFFDQRGHGEIMSLFTNDMDALQNALEQSIIQLLSGALLFIGSLVMMITLSPILFLVTLAMLVLMIVVTTQFGKRSSRYFRKQQEDISQVNGFIEEMMEGQRVIKVFNHQPQARTGFDNVNEAYQSSATLAQTFAGAIMPTMNNLNNINFAVTSMVGGLMALGGSFDIGSLVAYLQLARNFTQPLQQITNQANNVLMALAGAERIFAAMDEEPEVDEGTVTLVAAKINADGSIKELPIEWDSPEVVLDWAWKKTDGSMIPLKGDVRFDDVTFGYDPGQVVLDDISLYAKPGQQIAFVGSTGAGKTTITNLINRFYEIQEGAITYDGIDVRDIKKDDLRRSLGMVLQDTHLFTGTIADNIRYGRLQATDGEVKAAARMASADGFIRHLPDGYDTWITGDGENLSQGQRQLLAIARAAVANPPVLILDEATSSIDTRTEKLIGEGMDALMQDRTVFVIAHRLSTVRDANAIIVIEQGKIIERGDHADLIAQKGRYYKLYTGLRELA